MIYDWRSEYFFGHIDREGNILYLCPGSRAFLIVKESSD